MQRSFTDPLHVHPGVRAQHTHGDLFPGHFQREYRRHLALVHRGIFRDIHGKGCFTHGRARADDNQFAPVQAGQHVVQVRESGGHTGDLTLLPGQFLNDLIGVDQHFAQGFQFFPFLAVHDDIEDRLLRAGQYVL